MIATVRFVIQDLHCDAIAKTFFQQKSQMTSPDIIKREKVLKWKEAHCKSSGGDIAMYVKREIDKLDIAWHWLSTKISDIST